LARGISEGDEAPLVSARGVSTATNEKQKETSPSQERGEVSEGVGGSTGEEEHGHPLIK